jgi:hypothetical protein
MELRRCAGSLEGRSSGPWSAAEVIHHCAQSVELSLIGYPKLRSGLFRATVGPLAFARFKRRGALRHDRAAPIPGAPALPSSSLADALSRFEAAASAFARHEGPLTHFAFGALSKADMELAHAMHVADHLGDFPVRRG